MRSTHTDLHEQRATKSVFNAASNLQAAVKEVAVSLEAEYQACSSDGLGNMQRLAAQSGSVREVERHQTLRR